MRKLALIAAAGLLAVSTAAMAQDVAPATPAAPVGPAAAAAPAAAPAPGSTLANVIAKGIVLNAQGMDIDISFTPDGNFTSDLFAGKYAVDGNNLCLEIVDFGVTSCSAYPEGKASGDAFAIETEQGPLDVRIK